MLRHLSALCHAYGGTSVTLPGLLIDLTPLDPTEVDSSRIRHDSDSTLSADLATLDLTHIPSDSMTRTFTMGAEAEYVSTQSRSEDIGSHSALTLDSTHISQGPVTRSFMMGDDVEFVSKESYSQSQSSLSFDSSHVSQSPATRTFMMGGDVEFVSKTHSESTSFDSSQVPQPQMTRTFMMGDNVEFVSKETHSQQSPATRTFMMGDNVEFVSKESHSQQSHSTSFDSTQYSQSPDTRTFMMGDNVEFVSKRAQSEESQSTLRLGSDKTPQGSATRTLTMGSGEFISKQSAEDTQSTLSVDSRISTGSASKGTKPYFVRKLPSRVEMLEGHSFCAQCTVGRGCKPWFVKKLPPKIDIVEGRTIEAICVAGETTEEDLVAHMMEQEVAMGDADQPVDDHTLAIPEEQEPGPRAEGNERMARVCGAPVPSLQCLTESDLPRMDLTKQDGCATGSGIKAWSDYTSVPCNNICFRNRNGILELHTLGMKTEFGELLLTWS